MDLSIPIVIVGRKTSTTPSCRGPIPAQKPRGNSVLGVVFSHTIFSSTYNQGSAQQAHRLDAAETNQTFSTLIFTIVAPYVRGMNCV